LVRALHLHYDDYRNSDPGANGWALDRQVFRWVVPYHEGAVSAFRELGAWTEEDTRHNNLLLARQKVLADAWAEMSRSAPGDDAAFVAMWQQHRVTALKANGFDPIWR
jgi:hypothetical protein